MCEYACRCRNARPIALMLQSRWWTPRPWIPVQSVRAVFKTGTAYELGLRMLMSKVCGAANWHYDGEVAECWPIATAKAALTRVDAEDGDRCGDYDDDVDTRLFHDCIYRREIGVYIHAYFTTVNTGVK